METETQGYKHIKYPDGAEQYFLNGKLHRENGPASIDSRYASEYYLFGTRVTEREMIECAHMTEEEFKNRFSIAKTPSQQVADPISVKELFKMFSPLISFAPHHKIDTISITPPSNNEFDLHNSQKDHIILYKLQSYCADKNTDNVMKFINSVNKAFNELNDKLPILKTGRIKIKLHLQLLNSPYDKHPENKSKPFAESNKYGFIVNLPFHCNPYTGTGMFNTMTIDSHNINMLIHQFIHELGHIAVANEENVVKYNLGMPLRGSAKTEEMKQSKIPLFIESKVLAIASNIPTVCRNRMEEISTAAWQSIHNPATAEKIFRLFITTGKYNDNRNDTIKEEYQKARVFSVFHNLILKYVNQSEYSLESFNQKLADKLKIVKQFHSKHQD